MEHKIDRLESECKRLSTQITNLKIMGVLSLIIVAIMFKLFSIKLYSLEDEMFQSINYFSQFIFCFIAIYIIKGIKKGVSMLTSYIVK